LQNIPFFSQFGLDILFKRKIINFTQNWLKAGIEKYENNNDFWL